MNNDIKIDAVIYQNIRLIILGELKMAYMDGVIDALDNKTRNPGEGVQARYKKFSDLMDKLLGGEIKQ